MSSSSRLECLICLDSRAPDHAEDKTWVASTSCGHVFHSACLAKWHDTCGAYTCALHCTDRKMSFPKPMSRDRIPVPTLRLFFSSENGDAPSSDALAESQSQFLPYDPRGDATDEDDDDPDDIEEDDDEPTRLRRELRETRNTVRELAARCTDVDALRQEMAALEQRVEQRDEELADLRGQLAAVVTPEGAVERIGELEAEVEDLEKQVEKLEEEKERAAIEAKEKAESAASQFEYEYKLIQGDVHELQLKLREAQERYERAGEGGKKEIAKLVAEGNKKDALQLQTVRRADLAEDALAKLRKKSEMAISEAQGERDRLQRKYNTEIERAKRAEGGKMAYEDQRKKDKAKIAELKKKLRELAAAKGRVVESSDDEQSDRNFDPPPAQAGPSSSRTFARTASSRSDALPFDDADLDNLLGLSPSKAKAGPKVNNNSTLLTGSPRKMKRTRSVMDEAYEVSGEVEMEHLPPAVRQEVEEEDEDDDREPDTETDGEGSSDLEIVEPAASAPSTSRSRPFGSRPDLANRGLCSSSASFFSSSAPAPFQTLTASSSSSLASTSKPAFASSGGFGTKPKPALSQSRADKYMPGFLAGGSQGGKGGSRTLELGQKKRPKVGRK